MKRSLFALGISFMVMASYAIAEPITTGSLIGEMVEMHHLVEFPDPSYKTVQFSSYDHRSVLPGGPDWFANSDGFGKEPIPNFEATLQEPDANEIGDYLICDVEGPGALVRVWTAAIEGTIQLFLDGESSPVYAGKAQDFLTHPYQTIADRNGIEIPDLAETFQQRNAGYFPIPFQKRCRIVWTGNVKRIHFYQIQIRLYEDNAQVVSFQPDDLKTYRDEILKAKQILADPDEEWTYESSITLPIVASVPAKETERSISNRWTEGAGKSYAEGSSERS